MDKLFSFAPEEMAWHCLKRYIVEKGWKKLDDIVTDAQDIYDSVIYPDYEIRLITNEDLGYDGENKILARGVAPSHELNEEMVNFKILRANFFSYEKKLALEIFQVPRYSSLAFNAPFLTGNLCYLR